MVNRRKMLIGLGALAAGGAAATGTGAFTAMTANRDANLQVVDDSNGLIGLSIGGARGADSRVHVDESGELYIDFSEGASGTGINDDAVYQVGAMDDEAQGDGLNFDSIYDDDSVPPAAGDGRPYTTGGVNQSAFVVSNQSGQEIDLQIGWQLDEDESAGATIYLQGAASMIAADGPNNEASRVDGATATASIDLDDHTQPQTQKLQALSFNNDNPGDSDEWSGQPPFDGEGIPAGEAVYVSMQVDTRDAKTDPNVDLGGSLVINANEAAEPGVE
jgi:hypothetical protein